MMKILLIDESYPLNTRNTKILRSLFEHLNQPEIHVLTWDRDKDFDGGENLWNYHLYKRSAAYGNKWQKLIGLFGYKSFCHKVINTIHPDVIIASHWNNLLMLPRVDYKKQMVIYENLDAPTGPWLGRKVLNMIERCYMRRIALTIHASRFYTQIYPPQYPQLVLENKPTLDTTSIAYTPHKPLRIVYLGNIRYINILNNLVDAVRHHDNLQLIFHGGGPDYQTLLDYTSGLPNVICTGAYRYEDICKFYHNADVIWAAYPSRDFNVQYAISNKFHESIAYGIPAIYAENTRLAEFAETKRLGYKVNPYSVSDIEQLLLFLTKNDESLSEIRHALEEQKTVETTWESDIQQLTEHIKKHFI